MQLNFSNTTRAYLYKTRERPSALLCMSVAREDPQIARAIPVYSHPAPVFEAASSLQESYSTPEATGVPHHQVATATDTIRFGGICV